MISRVAIFAVLLLVPGSLAWAVPVSCDARVARPTYVRAESMGEALGEILVTCRGDPPPEGLIRDVAVAINTSIPGARSGAESEVLLVLGDRSVAPVPGSNAFRGRFTSSNAVYWKSVPLIPPGATPTSFVFRILNVRADASALGVSTAGTQTVLMFHVSIQGVQVRIIRPEAAVLNPAVRTAIQYGCDPSVTRPPLFDRTAAVNPGLAGGPRLTQNKLQFRVSFTEPFATAFKPAASSRPLLGRVPDAPTEAAASSTGLGTRLIVRFLNVPRGVELFAVLDAMKPEHGTSDGVRARLLKAADSSGGGPSTPMELTDNATCGSLAYPVARLAVTDGSAQAVWEILDADPNMEESLSLGFGVAFRPAPELSLPALGVATVSASLGPLRTGNSGSGTAPSPAFADQSQFQTAFTIRQPRNRVLFEVLANQVGYDSRITVANTSQWAGTCTLEYASEVPGGGPTPPPQTLPVLTPGGTTVFTLSGGGKGIDPAPGWMGCMVMTCGLTSFDAAYSVFPMTPGPVFREGKAAPLPQSKDGQPEDSWKACTELKRIREAYAQQQQQQKK